MPVLAFLNPVKPVQTQGVGVGGGVGGGFGNALYGGSRGAAVYSRVGQPGPTLPQIRITGIGGTTSGVTSTLRAPTIPRGVPSVGALPINSIPTNSQTIASMGARNFITALAVGLTVASIKYFEDNPPPKDARPQPGPVPANYYPSYLDFRGVGSTIGGQSTPARVPGSGLGTATGTAGQGSGLGGSLPSYTDPRFRAGGGVSTPQPPDLPYPQGPGWYVVHAYQPVDVFTGQDVGEPIPPIASFFGSLELIESVTAGEPNYATTLNPGGPQWIRSRQFTVSYKDGTSESIVVAGAGLGGWRQTSAIAYAIGAPPDPGEAIGEAVGPTPPPSAAAAVPSAPPALGSASIPQIPSVSLPTLPGSPATAATPQLRQQAFPTPTSPTQAPGPAPAGTPTGQRIPAIAPGTVPAVSGVPGVSQAAAPGPSVVTAGAPNPINVVPLPGLSPQPLPQQEDPPPPPPDRCKDPCIQGVADGVSGLFDLLSGFAGQFFGGPPPEELPPTGQALGDVISQIRDELDQLSGGSGGDPGLAALLGQIKSRVDEIGETQIPELGQALGADEFPATVPTSLISKEGQQESTKQLANLAQFLAWTVEQMDALFGQWEIPIEVEDTDLTQAGNQRAKLKLPNLAEATAEQVGLLLNLTTSVNALTNISMRALTEAGLSHKEAALAHIYGRENAQFLAYEGKEVEVKLPMSFNPGASSLEDTLKNTQVSIRGWENVDKQDLQFYFSDFLQAAAIIRSVYWKKIDKNGDIIKQIVDFVKEGEFLTEDSEREKDDFDNFLDRVEQGFTSATGITDPTKPYGREVTRRPRIRQLGNTGPSGGTIGDALNGN